MTILFHALPGTTAEHLWSGGADHYGNPPEHRVSDGTGVPCRHCLRMVPAGAPYLVLALRPFAGLHAYTETGPVFLCATPCPRPSPCAAIPEMLASPDYIIRGYDAAERIVYGTGAIVGRDAIPAAAAALFDARPDVRHVDVRSAANNCFQCRILPG